MKIRVTFSVSVDLKVNTEKPFKQMEDSIRDIIISMAADKITKQMLCKQDVTLTEIK